MVRIHFEKGKQKAFLDMVTESLDAPSIRSLLQFGISTNYSTLKNQYNERRTISKELFDELCLLAKIDKTTLEYIQKEDHWGQTKGGKISKRTKTLKVKQ